MAVFDNISGGGSKKKLYEALQYSGLVTEDMTYNEMLEVLSNTYPEKLYQSFSLSFYVSGGSSNSAVSAYYDIPVANAKLTYSFRSNSTTSQFSGHYIAIVDENGVTSYLYGPAGTVYYGISASGTVDLPLGRYRFKIFSNKGGSSLDTVSCSFVIKNYEL